VQDRHTLPVLEAVRNLIRDEGMWVKGNLCVSKRGGVVSYLDSRAFRFSLDGALYRAGHIMNRPVSPAYDYLCGLLSRSRNIPLASFNDAQQTTHRAVFDLLNKAITNLGGEALPYFEDDENV